MASKDSEAKKDASNTESSKRNREIDVDDEDQDSGAGGQSQSQKRSQPGPGGRGIKRNKRTEMDSEYALEYRLFVANLPIGTTEEELRVLFTRLLRKSGASGKRGSPVQIIKTGKTFAILEFLSKRETDCAFSFNGINFKGKNLKIQRPRGYAEKEEEQEEEYTDYPDDDVMTSLPGPDPNTIECRTLWVWNVPPGIRATELIEFFNSTMEDMRLTNSPGDPVIDCYRSRNRDCYIIEVRSVGETAQLLLLDRINFMGSSLTIARPALEPVAGSSINTNAMQAAMLPLTARFDRIISVTNVPPQGMVEDIVKLINDELQISRMTEGPGECIIGYQFDSTKNAAILEFRSSVEARGAVRMDGIPYLGGNLKIDWFDENQGRGGSIGYKQSTLPFYDDPLTARNSDWNMDRPGFNSSLGRDSWDPVGDYYDDDVLPPLPVGAKMTSALVVPRRTCKLYIGNLPGSYKDDVGLLTYLSRRMRYAGLQLAAGYPITKVEISENAPVAFIELRSLEETTKALALDGVAFQFKVLSIKRVNFYKPLPGHKEKAPTPRIERSLHVYCNTIQNEEEMANLFYRLVLHRGLHLPPGNPVINCQVKSNGKYFHLLLRSEKDVSICLSLNGANVGEHVLEIKRPGDPGSENQPSLRKLERRLHISNFPYGISEEELAEFFNKLMHQAGLAEGVGNCVVSCKIVPETDLARIELRSASEATKLLTLDDMNFKGQKVKIKRPPNYSPPSAEKVGDAAGTLQAADADPQQVAESDKIARVTEAIPQPTIKSEEFLPRNSSPAISSLIDESELTTNQVLKHVAEYRQKGLTGGAEFTAVANMLSVNISVLCANGTKMTYHPKVGEASATVEIQNPKIIQEPSHQGSNMGTSYSSADNQRQDGQRDSFVKPSLDNQRQIGQRDSFAKPSLGNQRQDGQRDNFAKPPLDNQRQDWQWDNFAKPSVGNQRQDWQRDSFPKPTVPPLLKDTSSMLSVPSAAWGNSSKPSHISELSVKSPNTAPGPSSSAETNWLIATWNVRGATSKEKQLSIDDTMHSESVEIAALQETYLSSSSFDTSHYKWLLSSDSQRSMQGGVGFLVRRDLASMISRWTPISDYLACLHLKINDITLTLITVLISFDASAAIATLDRLVTILMVLPTNNHVFVFGDFNGQIGTNDLVGSERSSFGPYLGHTHSNKNGFLLQRVIRECQLFHLPSLLGNNSTLVTRSQGSESAQVDHILGNCPSSVHRVAAGFIPNVHTDHKLMWAVVSMLPCPKHRV